MLCMPTNRVSLVKESKQVAGCLSLVLQHVKFFQPIKAWNGASSGKEENNFQHWSSDFSFRLAAVFVKSYLLLYRQECFSGK